MKITLVRSGGFAGLARQHVIEVAQLPRAARALIETAFTKAKLERLAAATPAPSGADRFSYHLTCTDPHNAFDVMLHEAALNEDVSRGIAALLDHAAAK